MTTETKELTAFDFLPHQKFYLHFWDQELVEEGMRILGITKEKITEQNIVTGSYVPSPSEYLGVGWGEEYREVTVPNSGGQTLSGYIRVKGNKYRVTKRYLGAEHIKLIKWLLVAAFPQLSMTIDKFEVYEPSSNIPENYEIYLRCNIHPDDKNQVGRCIYCPIKGILEKNWSIIEQRHVSYHEGYYNDPERKEKFLGFALGALESPQALELKALLENSK